MLRRAMDLGGFHQVIFISHTPVVSELADEIVTVCAGSVVTSNRQAAVNIEPANICGVAGQDDVESPLYT